MKRTLTKTLLGTALAFALASPSFARDIASVHEAREEAARTVASLLADPAFDAALRAQLADGEAALKDVIGNYRRQASPMGARRADVADELGDIERTAIRLRGLDGVTDSLLDLRLYGAGNAPLSSFRDVWTATVSKHPTTGEKQVVAYDAQGTVHTYALDAVPRIPMLIVEADGEITRRAGIAVMNEVLQRRDAPSARTTRRAARDAAGPEQLTILRKIHLARDQEPDISGRAEVFAFVSGVGADRKAQVKSIDMPWLDHDKTVYTPNQDLITWSDYDSPYVNVTFLEDDGDTNFKKLAVGISESVTLGLAAFPATAPYALVGKVGELILKSLDDKLFTNDIDYIDSLYVVERNTTYVDLKGAASNATVTLEPYEVKAR